MNTLKVSLQKTRQRMETQANKHRKDHTFNPGDLVLLRLQPYRQQTLAFSLCVAASVLLPMNLIFRRRPRSTKWYMYPCFALITTIILPATSNLCQQPPMQTQVRNQTHKQNKFLPLLDPQEPKFSTTTQTCNLTRKRMFNLP